MMKLHTFLDSIAHKNKYLDYSVVCFSGTLYPVLFFSYLVSFLKKNDVVTHIDNSADDSFLKSCFEIEQLSGTCIYWLGDISSLSSKQLTNLLTYLQSYNGPHKILFFCSDDVLTKRGDSSMITISVPHIVRWQELTSITSLFFGEAMSTEFIKNIAQRVDTVPLDSACILAHYSAVLGKNFSLFFDLWFDNIIEPKTSLFILSQYLFSKKSKPFFKQWSLISESFLPPFWVAYFADQIWHAYMYSFLMKRGEFVAAKKVQYKLPYSFINHDWRLYLIPELQNAHQFLYRGDFHLKNGGTSGILELFFCSFFNGKFK